MCKRISCVPQENNEPIVCTYLNKSKKMFQLLLKELHLELEYFSNDTKIVIFSWKLTDKLEVHLILSLWKTNPTWSTGA